MPAKHVRKIRMWRKRAELSMQVVNTNQQLIHPALSPRSSYSRIVVLHCAAAGGGVYNYDVSQALGKDFWLLQVDVTLQTRLGGLFDRAHFSLHRGGTRPSRYQDVRVWDHLIPFGVYAGFDGMVVYGPWRQFTFNLSRRFQGEANRLAVLLYNAGVGVAVVHVFLTISEG